jgi:hypothetical protein
MTGAPAPAGGAAGTRTKARPAGRSRALVGGAGALAVVAIAGGILAPKLFSSGSSDPGCKAFANTALTAYNKAITDLNNSHASAATLNADMTAAITELTAAAAKAQASNATSALDSLLAQLKTVRTDVAQGSVPGGTVNTLNADANAADTACR